MITVSRHATRNIAWGVVVAVTVTAAFLLVAPDAGFGQVPDSIDLTGGVEAGNCAPCHMQLGEAQRPGLVFSHGNHLMVSCEGCHYGPAHSGGETVAPPMEACFTCHGVAHGPAGELATSACADCHTPSFPLRPKSHVKDWAKKPHAERAAKDSNQCMLCHEAATDCDLCHEEQGVDVGKMPGVYLSIMPVRPKTPAVTVYPRQPTSMGQCIYCHPDVDDFLPGRVIFAHADHLKRNFQCTVCHPQFGHGIEQIRRPDMLSCYRCHGLTHAKAGELATQECYACHPKDFELKPSDHTKDFEAGKHKERANTEPEYCAMCHQAEFCVECHMGRRKLPQGGSSAKVIPVDHKKVEWLSSHGGFYLEQKGSCGSCHDSSSCKLCHKTVMPHPPDWLENHAPENDADREDCNVCHTNRDSCQNCHHDKVKRAELVEGNCVPCHEPMKQKPATGIKNKGFAEHAVHFNVAEKKGKPYKCYDCHVSFGSSDAAREVEKLQGHDLRLCYECHGALSVVDKKEIAPYVGAELCRKCHADIGV